MNNYSIQEAIKKRRILPFSDGPKIVSKELKAGKDDLQDAKDIFARGRFKWATVQAYYAIYHATRALLYKKRYREKSHIQLVLAIKVLYIDNGLLPQEYYENFIQALDLREMADYKSKFSANGAERNIRSAEEAIELAENILKIKKSDKTF